MGKFWINDDFIRIEAKKLSSKAINVYMALCCHSNYQGFTFIGQRLLGQELGLNKDTVGLAIKELVASGLVGHYKKGKHGVSGLTIASVRNDKFQRPTEPDRRKSIKESYKEEDLKVEPSPIKDVLRERWGKNRINS